jgi:hypothetical protein
MFSIAGRHVNFDDAALKLICKRKPALTFGGAHSFQTLVKQRIFCLKGFDVGEKPFVCFCHFETCTIL